MNDKSSSRAEAFLKQYRVLEVALEKRCGGEYKGSSVVMDYIRDVDSEPYRHELDMCREIRNLLTHNADASGEPVVEPSEEILETLGRIVEYVRQPRFAMEYATAYEKILCARSGDSVRGIMRRMVKNGYSHIPVLEQRRVVGVFSASCLMEYLEKCGLDALSDGAQIGHLKDFIGVERSGSRKYLFLPKDTTIVQVRVAFETYRERNNRLCAVFLTENGRQNESLLAMLTPWDALKDTGNID